MPVHPHRLTSASADASGSYSKAIPKPEDDETKLSPTASSKRREPGNGLVDGVPNLSPLEGAMDGHDEHMPHSLCMPFAHGLPRAAKTDFCRPHSRPSPAPRYSPQPTFRFRHPSTNPRLRAQPVPPRQPPTLLPTLFADQRHRKCPAALCKTSSAQNTARRCLVSREKKRPGNTRAAVKG